MKRLISLIICAVLAAAFVPMTVGAAGMVLFEDHFNEANPDNWMYDSSHFVVFEGHLEGYRDAVVHQSQFDEDYGGTKMWGNGTSFRVETWCYEDEYGDGTNMLKLWWADYFGGTWDNESRIVYYFGYRFGDHKLVLHADYAGEEAAQYQPGDEDSVDLYEVDFKEMKIDLAAPEHFTLGMKIENGVIYCFCNDQLVITHQAERGALCGTQGPAPVLLWNSGCYCGWDDFIVATSDYKLFGEGAETEPVVTDPIATEPATTRIETKVVEEKKTVTDDAGNAVTDESGNAVTEIVTKIEEEIVTNAPPADTQGSRPSGNGGAQTGDTALIVIAVMTVAVAAAAVVKKVNN